MKAIITASLFLISANCFAASSVCIFVLPALLGATAFVDCDGKVVSQFDLDENYIDKQATTLAGLLNKGYKIVSESNNQGQDQYTLAK